jgi:hypothetical protein
MPWRNGQELAFVLWLFGVPALAGGLAFDAIPFVSAAAWCLFAASLIDTVNVIRILRYAFPDTVFVSKSHPSPRRD